MSMHLQNLCVCQSKGTGWRALSSTQSTEIKILNLLWLLKSAFSCSRRISQKNRFSRCVLNDSVSLMSVYFNVSVSVMSVYFNVSVSLCQCIFNVSVLS